MNGSTRLAGWGRFPVHGCSVSAPRDEAELRAAVLRGAAIARGNGRAYGDSALSRENTISTRRLNRMLAFDPARGRLVAEAGVMLHDVIATFLPRGWFPAVTPGTKFVTVGGMIAADVHGKNHHRDGAFSNFVDWIDLMGPDGVVRRCSRDEEPERFAWTFGAMGLTGVVLRAAVRLRAVQSGWIDCRTIAAPRLRAALEALERADAATYSVAWIDCLSRGDALGRSLIMTGEHLARDALGPDESAEPFPRARKALVSVPWTLPSAVLNRYSVRAFNRLYYRRGSRDAPRRPVHWDSFFYPLDRILAWNRIYGRDGFAQFQCVLPPEASAAGLEALLERISGEGQGSFLAVLKRLGEQDSPFGFPRSGYTLALDFPIGPRTADLLEGLDRIALEHGGRFYLAKDSRMSPRTLRESDGRTADFVAMRAANGSA